jgi:hypothetical protein
MSRAAGGSSPRRAIEILYAAATAAALIPVWLFRWFPTQDGPSHLYNSFVLAHYYDAASALVRAHFVLNLRPFPNWTTYALMALLVRVFPPLAVQQIILSLCVISIPAAIVYLQKSFKPSADPSALLGILLSFSFVFFMGFFNFIVGAALFVVATGFWWRRREGRYLYGLYALLIAIYFSHDLTFGVTLMAIATLAAVERRWRVFLELAPAFLIFALDVVTRPRGQVVFRTFEWHLRQLPAMFSAGHIAIAAVTLLVVIAGVIWSFVRARPNPFALISLILFVAYFVSPWAYSVSGWPQAAWINERLLYLTILTLPAWIALPRPPIATAILLVALAAHLGATSLQIAKLNAYIGDIMRSAPLIRPHSTIRTFFPVSEMKPRVTPTLHLDAYFGLQTDVVDLDDYEAYRPDFPVAYRARVPLRQPDYIIAWGGADVPPMSGYRLIFANAAIRLYHVLTP